MLSNINKIVIVYVLFFVTAVFGEKGIWISYSQLQQLPISGAAWDKLKSAAEGSVDNESLSTRNDANTQTLAKALVYARTGDSKYRDEVINVIAGIIGTEGTDALATWRRLGTYVIAADLVGLPAEQDQVFKSWLKTMQTKKLEPAGRSLIETQEIRPNNHGTHAGASRAAVAIYLGDTKDLERCAQVFKGYLGDRSSYAGFKYGDLSWQYDPENPVGINPKGATKEGHSIDGVLPDDQRRGGRFTWPPPKENYVYGALQGALVEAVILYRAGYDVWNWEDKALLRAFEWLYNVANFPPEGDDNWEPHIVNYYYGTNFSAPVPANVGKNMGWTDWTHGNGSLNVGELPARPASVEVDK